MLFGLGPAGWFTYPWFTNPYLYMHPRFPYGGPPGYRYYLTGLPGWMRFGFSPGWLGRSPTGLGPTASYLMTGQWPTPQAQAYWEAMQEGQTPYPMYGGAGAVPYSFSQTPGATPEQELSFLKDQGSALKSQIDQINSRIKELEKKEK